MEDKKYLLEIKNLSVVYNIKKEKVTAVDDVSLNIKKGESLGIIGESGCGKSSLALGMMGLITEGKVTGEVLYKNKNLLQLSERKLKKYRWQKIAIVFQNSLEVLNPVLTIKEQLKEPLEVQSDLSSKEINKKIIELLEMVGLNSEWQDEYPHQLSGGMRQRVLIAMALACEPELLIIDEPTSSLDPVTKKEIINLLVSLKNKFTMIVISHDIEAIKKLSSTLITMYCGRFVEIGFTSEVIKNPQHCYTRGLLNSSPDLFQYKDLWGIRGTAQNNSKNRGCAFYFRCPQSEENCQYNTPELKYVGVERKVACNKGGIETFLEAKNINKTYKLKNGKNIKAVKDVDLKIKSGEILGLVGKSGSGKSTLAHVLAGVLSSDSGQIKFMGNKVQANWATRMIGGMQIVFQDPFSATSNRLSVLEVVQEPLDIIKWKDTSARKKKAITEIEKVQLPVNTNFLNRACRNLSGGQRQRIAIARALVTDPRLLIADEITSMLDPSIQANIIRRLEGLQNSQGFSMLYITHNLNLARKIADKIYVMNNGCIVEKGISSELFKNPGERYTKELIST